MNRTEMEKKLKRYGTTIKAIEKGAELLGLSVEQYFAIWLKVEQEFEEYGENYLRLDYVEDLDALEQ